MGEFRVEGSSKQGGETVRVSTTGWDGCRACVCMGGCMWIDVYRQRLVALGIDGCPLVRGTVFRDITN